MAATVEVIIAGTDNASGVIGGIGGALSNLGNIVTGIKSAFDLMGSAWDTAVDFAQPFIDSASESQVALSGLDTVLRSTAGGAGLFTETVGRLSAVSLLELEVKLDHAKDKLGEMKDAFGNVKTYTDEETLAIMRQKEEISSLTAQIERGANGLTIYRDTTQLSRDALIDLAGALQDVTRFSDEEVLSAEAMLLRFENLNSKIFPDAIRLTTDLAQSLGIELPTAARMIGMALDDPERGIGRLNTAFRIFTETEMDTIKGMAAAGDMAGAQALIMQALTEKVGGAAEAYGKTFAGSLEIARNRLDEIREIIGGAVLPVLTGLITQVTEFASRPEVLKFFEDLGTSIAVFLDKLELSDKLENFLSLITTAMQTGDWQPVWDAIVETFETIKKKILELFSGEGGIDIQGQVQKLVDMFTVAVAGADWKGVTDTFIGVVENVLLAVFTGLDIIINKVDWGPFGAALSVAISEAWKGATEGIDLGYTFETYVIDPFVNWLKNNWTTLIFGPILAPTDSFKTLWKAWINDHIVIPFKQFLGIASPSTLFAQFGKDIITGLINGLDSLVSWAIGKVTGIVADILAPFKPVLELLGIDTSWMDVSSTGSIGGGSMGGTTTTSTGGTGTMTGLATTVNQYFQGANIYVGSWDEIAYNCIYPNPFVAATSGQIGTTGGGGAGAPR
jgi:hypothetical protein